MAAARNSIQALERSDMALTDSYFGSIVVTHLDGNGTIISVFLATLAICGVHYAVTSALFNKAVHHRITSKHHQSFLTSFHSLAMCRGVSCGVRSSFSTSR